MLRRRCAALPRLGRQPARRCRRLTRRRAWAAGARRSSRRPCCGGRWSPGWPRSPPAGLIGGEVAGAEQHGQGWEAARDWWVGPGARLGAGDMVPSTSRLHSTGPASLGSQGPCRSLGRPWPAPTSCGSGSHTGSDSCSSSGSSPASSAACRAAKGSSRAGAGGGASCRRGEGGPGVQAGACRR